MKRQTEKSKSLDQNGYAPKATDTPDAGLSVSRLSRQLYDNILSDLGISPTSAASGTEILASSASQNFQGNLANRGGETDFEKGTGEN